MYLDGGFITSYPYMFWSGLLFFIFWNIYFFSGTERRKAMLLSGLLCVPFAFASVFFVPEYWQPVRVAAYIAGPEDLLFSFSTGAMAWFFATLNGKQPRIEIQFGRVFWRYLKCCALWMCLFLLLKIFFLNVMDASILAIAASGGFLWVFEKQLPGPSLWGCIAFCFAYELYITLAFLVTPGFVDQWNTENLWGYCLLNVPLEELVWAAGFGIVWPMLISYVLETTSELR